MILENFLEFLSKAVNPHSPNTHTQKEVIFITYQNGIKIPLKLLRVDTTNSDIEIVITSKDSNE